MLGGGRALCYSGNMKIAHGTMVTLIYKGKLGADGLSGSVVTKGAEDQFSRTWKARK
jgi:hypothetical protein